MAAWVCGRCGRRVPGYVDACHCGAGRVETRAAEDGALARNSGARFDPRDVPWPAWAAAAVLVLALVGGVVSLVRRHEPEPIVPLLGYVDRMPARRTLPSRAPSSPSPTASVASAQR